MNKKLIKYLSVALLLMGFSALVYAKGGGDRKAPASTSGSPSWTHFNINNMSTWFQNTGSSDINQNGNSGLVFPKGSGRTAAFQSGFIWGGNVDGAFQVGGSTYYQGTLPGRIVSPGVAEDPNNADVRIYRVRRDYKDPHADFSAEVADGEGTASQVYAQYDLDWQQWPADQGAPYEDVNGNGKYDPAVDIPGVPGADQTIWFVANDLDPATVNGMYGGLPMGIEEQATIWGYKATGALGNMFFRKYTIINKNANQSPFTDMYVSMWSDVDLGDAGDDFIGCDTTLSLMYFYNGKATDLVYSPLPPPSTGFDFFQGPAIPTGNANDRAIFKNKYKYGYKNLPMTGFYFFINPDPVYADPGRANYTTGVLEFKNLFEGKISTTGQPFTDPNTGAVTKFPLAGDPVTHTGWIDGQLHPPGDRRGGMTSGPFEMAYGDTQEVVVSEMCAGATPGVDRLGAVQLLKFYDAQAQTAYNNFFNVPTAPPAPAVLATGFDQEVVISWGSDPTAVNNTESYSNGGYAFQGYNVYQIDPTGQAAPIRLATYDVVDGVGKILDPAFDPVGGVVTDKVVAFGNDTGIKRTLDVTLDAFNGNTILRNGSRYIFAVTSYAYNPDPNVVPHVLENQMATFTVVPHAPDPGVRYQGTVGQVLTVTHSAGNSDGIVTPTVIDPSKVDGSTYSVSFGTQNGSTVWNLSKGSTSVLSNQTHFGTDDAFPIVDGVEVGVQDAPAQIKGPGEGDGMVEVAYGGTVLPASKYDAAGAPYKGNKVWHSLNSAQTIRYYVTAGGGAGEIARLYRFVNYASPRDFEFRFTDKDAYGVYGFTDDKICKVPFEIWCIGVGTPDDPKDDYRMIPLINNNAATSDTFGWDTGTDAYFGYAMSDWVYWMDPKDATPGDKGYKQFENSCIQSGGAGATYNYNFDTDPTAGDYNANFHGGFVYPIGRFAIGDYTEKGLPPAGTVIRLNYTKPITTSDVYKFTAPSVVNDPNLAKTDVQEINVFPNPYYGVNPQELNKYQRFVTFSHLPAKATLRIFNLAGQQVRKLEKNTTDQFFRWDLANENQLPVASGLYIVYIDMPDLGTTKILKVAIIQEQQVLDRF